MDMMLLNKSMKWYAKVLIWLMALVFLVLGIACLFGKSSPAGGALGVLMGLSDLINNVN